MTKITLRGILARRLRSALTAAAVLLGVTVISGTLVFTDTINHAVSRAVTDAARGADVVVSGRAPVDSTTQAPTVSAAVLRRIQRLPGVERAQGEISDQASIVDPKGGTVQVGAGGTRAFSFVGPPFQAIQIVSGRPPRQPHEVLVDEETAKLEHYHRNQRITISTLRPARPFKIVGFMRFGGATNLGTTLLAFDLAAAQRFFLKPDQVDFVDVAGRPGVTPPALVAQIAPLLGPRLIVRSATDQARQDTDRIFNELSFLTEALLAFGLIAVFVGAFVIFNTFSITVAQRTRELGLLRTLGASRRQLLVSVLLEGLAIGLGGSLLATLLGFGLAGAISSLLAALGVRLPSTSPVLELRTVGVCVAVGVSVTLLSSLIPALRATRVPPLAALREGVPLTESRLTAAIPWLALVLTGVGVLLTINGLSHSASVGTTAAGAVALAVGVAVLTPRIVPLAARVAGWPLEQRTALTGRLAWENAARNPQRTAATAAALMIGLALVLFVTIFAAEARSAIRDVVARSFAGDLAVTNQDGFSPIPPAAAKAVARVRGVETVSVLKRSDSRLQVGGTQSANGIDTQTLGSVYRFDWVDGDDSLLGLLGPNGALVERDLAVRADLNVGSHFVVTTPSGKQTELTVRGIYRDRALLGGYSVALPTFDHLFHELRARRILVKLVPGTDMAAAGRRVNNALAAFPETRARSEQQLKDVESNSLNSILYLFYALLAISVFVSLFGIVNTLTLSIHERRRELGTLRALGASRRTIRRIVRYESVITALIGGTLGLTLGVFFAAVVTASLHDEGLRFSVPVLAVAGLVALTAGLGVLAAIPPARRAARLDLLAAIAYD
jgi:putative ABC transport system permease protein